MKILLFILALVSASCSAEKGKMNIFYIPIGVETYVPITEDNIEASSVKSAEIDVSGRLAKKVTSLISGAGKGGFDGEKIRVKLVKQDQYTVYVDNNGGIYSSGDGVSQLSSSDLAKLKNILEKHLN